MIHRIQEWISDHGAFALSAAIFVETAWGAIFVAVAASGAYSGKISPLELEVWLGIGIFSLVNAICLSAFNSFSSRS